MEITWHGNTCFSLKGKDLTIVINPDKQAGSLKGDVVFSSLGDKAVGVEGAKKVFDSPGEYEMSDVPITALQAWTASRSKEDEAKPAPSTIIFYFEIDGIKVCHLGDLGHILSSDMINEIGDVDILMIGGNEKYLEDKKAVEVLEAIDPRAVIPMGVKNNQEFYKLLGLDNVQLKDKFTIKAITELPEEKREYIILEKV